MQEVYLYSHYDKKGDRFDTPFFTANDMFAKRLFIMNIQDGKSIMSNFKEDFELFKVGKFNVITGELESCKEMIEEGKKINKLEEK